MLVDAWKRAVDKAELFVAMGSEAADHYQYANPGWYRLQDWVTGFWKGLTDPTSGHPKCLECGEGFCQCSSSSNDLAPQRVTWRRIAWSVVCSRGTLSLAQWLKGGLPRLRRDANR